MPWQEESYSEVGWGGQSNAATSRPGSSRAWGVASSRGHNLSLDPCGASRGAGVGVGRVGVRMSHQTSAQEVGVPEALSPHRLTDLVSVPHPRQGIEQLRGQQHQDTMLAGI